VPFAEALSRRKEYLCWGLLALAKHAGEESLRRHSSTMASGHPAAGFSERRWRGEEAILDGPEHEESLGRHSNGITEPTSRDEGRPSHVGLATSGQRQHPGDPALEAFMQLQVLVIRKRHPGLPALHVKLLHRSEMMKRNGPAKLTIHRVVMLAV
jgi:hypothetical protein